MKNPLIKLLLLCILFSYASLSLAAEKLTISINGISGDALTNVQNRLQTLQQNYGDTLSVADVEDFYQQAPENIQAALKPYGYFKAKIASQLQHQTNQWQASFNIIPGPRLKISKTIIEVVGIGKDNVTLSNIVQNFPIQAGQNFISPDYTKAKQKLFNTALQQGYLTAYFVTQSVAINLQHYTCVITLTLNTGPRFYFGPISFSKSPLSDNFLQRYATFQTGEAFSSEKLLAMHNALSGSNYFESVSIDSNVSQAQNHHVPITVNVIMRKAVQYLFGIGFGTDTGPRLTLGNNIRYLNADGHYLNSQATLSPVQSNIQASYIIPGENPSTDQYAINANVMSTHLNQGDSTTEQIGATDTALYPNDWLRTLSLNYLIEQFKFDQQPGQTSHLLIPGLTLSNTIKNDPLFPTQGNRFIFSLQGSPQIGISSVSFIQAEVQDKFITHFTDNDRFILRGDIGYTAVHNADLFPLSLRFYAGGTQSVRGFSYQSLGPGNYLITSSAEFQQRITGKFYGAIFYDAGNASNDFDMALQHSAGIGVVWASPIGTMELSLAQVQSLPDKPLRLQFVMGPDL